jgi:hypothetical protein
MPGAFGAETPGVARLVVVLFLLGLASLVWHSRPRLWLLLLPHFLVARFPAVGDLRQEPAGSFYIFFGPGMNGPATNFQDCGCGQFPDGNVAGQRSEMQSQPFRCVIGRDDFHSYIHIDDRFQPVKNILPAQKKNLPSIAVGCRAAGQRNDSKARPKYNPACPFLPTRLKKSPSPCKNNPIQQCPSISIPKHAAALATS